MAEAITQLKPDELSQQLRADADYVRMCLNGELRGRLQEYGYKFLAGCRLLRMKEKIKHGNTINGEGFEKVCAREFPESPMRSIYFRVEVAEKILARSKEFPVLKHQPLQLARESELSLEQQQVILKLVPEVMDGKGMVEFLRDTKQIKEPELAGGTQSTPEQLSKPRKPTAAEIAKEADDWTRDRAGWLGEWSLDKKRLVLAKTKTLQQMEAARVKLGKQIELILEKRKGAKPAKAKGTK